MSRRLRWLIALFAVFALLAAACGDDDDTTTDDDADTNHNVLFKAAEAGVN